MADRLKVTDLDFDTIKNNLKAFLKQQSEFTDYDFEGAGLNILLDILAYNTHYSAYYLNMVANEAFLDTALLRDSVVSHAKTLGYIPYSSTSSVATINFTANAATSTSATLTIPRGYTFLSNQIDGISYVFTVLEDVVATKANSKYFFENLEIKQGDLVSYQFINDQSENPKHIFILPDDNIDTSSLRVSIAPNISSTELEVYTRVDDILEIDGTSAVYFLEENRTGKYQLTFGDGNIGKTIPDGGVIYVSYLVTSGPDANKADGFVASGPLVDSIGTSQTNFLIEVVGVASGGSNRETTEEIKFSATSQYSTQNRLVTYKDYETYIKNKYPVVESVSIWGGEDNIPRIYGKVFISLKPKENYFISEVEKQRIIDEIIGPKTIISVSTEILDPEYVYVLIGTDVRYNPRKTLLSEEAIKSSVRTAISSYNTNYLNKFGSSLIISRLQDEIDSADPSIIGNDVSLRLQKRVVPNLGRNSNYTIRFNTSIKRGTTVDKLTSSEFTVFDRSGVLRAVTIEEIPQSFSGVSEILVTNPGSGYTSTPTVTITGDGVGATATAKIVNGRIESITVDKRGYDYSRAVVTITGGNGFGADAIAVVDSKIGELRTSYFDTNAERIIVNENVGTIDYTNGILNLSDLRIETIVGGDSYIKITVGAETGIVETVRNSLITIDENDPTSIVITAQKTQ